MALLAEEIVEEWLNCRGYFTIRGIKLGVHEMDLLAVRFADDGGLECRHIEVQASMRPISYITQVPKVQQREQGRPSNSAKKRSDEDLRQGIREWIAKKFDAPQKIALRQRLVPAGSRWSREVVLHHVLAEREVELIREAGIEVTRLREIVAELGRTARSDRMIIAGAAGGHLMDLIAMGGYGSSADPSDTTPQR